MKKKSSRKLIHLTTLLVLTAWTILSPVNSFAQGYLKSTLRNTNCLVSDHQADRWYFGQNAGLDFRQQNPVADLTNFNMNVPTSTSIISDSLGNVLFFTDGSKVWNRNQQIMPNGDGLHGHIGSTQPVLIVPKPGSEDIYYIFTTHRPEQGPGDPGPFYTLEYNEVDLSQDAGQGAITKKNKELLPTGVQMSSKLTATLHGNGVDYWVVAHKFNSNEFCSFRVTESGVDTTGYVSSSLGTVHAGPGSTNNSIGYMKISPDGSKLALAIHGSDVFEIYNFNNSTGQLSGVITSDPVFDEAYGVEFSSDSRYLYGTTTSVTFVPPLPASYLYQFDINQGSNIFNTSTQIAEDLNGSYFGGMQLGTDGRIYVSRSPNGNAALSVIENPKRPGLACNFNEGAMDLAGKRSRFGLPNFVQTYFDLPHFDVENVCFSDTTYFILQNNSNIESISWNFAGEGTSTNTQATHIFSGPGEYQVEVREFFGGVEYGPYIETVIVNELPEIAIPDTVYMYPGSPILLDAGAGFTSYEWSNGTNAQMLTVSEPGLYWVTVQNERCCFNLDSVRVIIFDVLVPNAFRPGGVNNIFKAYPSSNEAIRNFSLYIYNRWGQQIFLSNDIDLGWDGRVKGKDAPGDVYVWLVTYDVEREGRTERISYKGNVVLLR